MRWISRIVWYLPQGKCSVGIGSTICDRNKLRRVPAAAAVLVEAAAVVETEDWEAEEAEEAVEAETSHFSVEEAGTESCLSCTRPRSCCSNRRAHRTRRRSSNRFFRRRWAHTSLERLAQLSIRKSLHCIARSYIGPCCCLSPVVATRFAPAAVSSIQRRIRRRNSHSSHSLSRCCTHYHSNIASCHWQTRSTNLPRD